MRVLRGNVSFLGILFLFLLGMTLLFPLKAQENEESFQKQAALFSQHCAKCHTIGKGLRVGPDLKKINERREKAWLIQFISNPSRMLDSDPLGKQLLEDFKGVRMPDLKLSPQTAESLLEYIETVSKGTEVSGVRDLSLPQSSPYKKLHWPEEGKSFAIHYFSFGIFCLLLALSSTYYSKRSLTSLFLVLSLPFFYAAFGGRQYHQLPGNQQGYEPQQPLHYSHKLHAGDLEISCLYCHSNATKGDVAGVPALNVCMNCHRAFQKENSPDLQKLQEIWDSRQLPIPRNLEWKRVHRLPDFVYFSHQAHVQNEIKCQECHGPVEEMERIRQVSDLSMGFCIDCHRKENSEIPSHWKRAKGPLDCTACHQ
jgi:mono/diheme cytochrome c family protein